MGPADCACAGSASAGAKKPFLGLVSEASPSASAKMKFAPVKERQAGKFKACQFVKVAGTMGEVCAFLTTLVHVAVKHWLQADGRLKAAVAAALTCQGISLLLGVGGARAQRPVHRTWCQRWQQEQQERKSSPGNLVAAAFPLK